MIESALREVKDECSDHPAQPRRDLAPSSLGPLNARSRGPAGILVPVTEDQQESSKVAPGCQRADLGTPASITLPRAILPFPSQIPATSPEIVKTSTET